MLYKFTGAGNNFVVLDGRGRDMAPYRAVDRIQALCRQYSTDGLMILGLDPEVDFSMEFYNPDGTGGMMCGNGGRCIVAFADMLGLKPAASDGTWLFRAPDGPHTATVISSEVEKSLWTVRLKMINVEGITPMMGGYFLNTGTRHFVKFVEDVDAMDMERDAKPLRWDPAFQPEGTNVNFVQVATDGLHVRTFEKGVEGETLACGTGLTASALAAYRHGIPGQAGDDEERHGRPLDEERHGRLRSAISYRLQCRRGDWLQVEFHPAPGDRFTDVYLTGPAECVEVIE
ncbi:MAG: diaminopimelate epimerase [Bacteroidales bacterium]|nr:diaminopimelate epimerase [Bacteroidales bacterium]